MRVIRDESGLLFEQADADVVIVTFEPEVETAAASDQVRKTLEAIEKTGDRVAEAAAGVVGKVARALDAAQCPDEFTVAFSLAVAGEGSVVVAKASADASITVTATWRRSDASGGTPA